MSEGEPQHFFDIDATTVGEEALAATNEDKKVQEGDVIPAHVYHLGTAAEDIAHVRGLGFEVDDEYTQC